MSLRFFLVMLSMSLLCAGLGGCHRVKYPINVNTASARDLEDLPDIGPKIAAAIVAGRPYKSVDDLLRVKGIGPKTLQKIRDSLATLSASQEAAVKD